MYILSTVARSVANWRVYGTKHAPDFSWKGARASTLPEPGKRPTISLCRARAPPFLADNCVNRQVRRSRWNCRIINVLSMATIGLW